MYLYNFSYKGLGHKKNTASVHFYQILGSSAVAVHLRVGRTSEQAQVILTLLFILPEEFIL